MSTFGGALWGGGGAASGNPEAVGVPLSSLIMPAYRIAGLITQPMLKPHDDMYAECIPELNRLTGTLNLQRLNIFTIRIDAFNLTAGQKTYTVGPGADFDMPRPNGISNGVIGLGPVGSDGLVRMPPMHQADDEEWARIALQDIPNGIPLGFYYDGSYDQATGYGLIYLWPQDQGGHSVEWYTWQAIPKFQGKDDLVALPDGGEDLLVHQLAERLAALNPETAKMSEEARRTSRRILSAWQSHNAPTPTVQSDFKSKTSGGGHWDYRIGMTR